MAKKQLEKTIVIGTFCLNTCPDITSVLSSHLDFLIIDREHGRANLEKTLYLLNSINNDCEKFVRVSACERVEIQKVLELDPEGILVPQISSFEDAKNAVDYSFYPSIGTKGLSPYTRAFKFSPEKLKEKKIFHNEKFKLSLLIEGNNGFESLDKILEAFNKNIYMIYFGLFDYANTIKVEPNWENSELKSNLILMKEKCSYYNIKVGTIARNNNELQLLKSLNIDYIVYQNDTGILNEALNKIT